VKQRLPLWKLICGYSLLKNTFRIIIVRNCRKIIPLNKKVTWLGYFYFTWMSVMRMLKIFLYLVVCYDN
jgi:hypothetical protein